MKTQTMITLLGAALVTGGLSAAPLAGQAANTTTSQAIPAQKTAPAQATKKDDAKPPKATVADDEKDAIKIGLIADLAFTGNLAFVEEEGVKELLADRLCDGQEKTIGDLRKAMAEVRSTLIDRGFYLVQVQPAAKDAYDKGSKVLTMLVDPGKMGDVKITLKDETSAGDGHVWYSKEQIANRFKHLEKNAPFNYLALRRAISAVNSHPNMQSETKLALREKPAAGEQADSALTKWVDAELEVTDSFPFHASLTVDNFAMEELDDWEASVMLQYLNLTGADDVLTVTPSMTFNTDMMAISAGYVRPFEFLLGGSFNLYGGWSDMDVEDISPRLNLEGTGWFAGAGLSFNLYDSDARNLALTLGFMYRYVEDEYDVLGTRLQKRDVEIMPFTLGLSYSDKKRDWLGGYDFLSLSVTQNLNDSGDNFRRYSEAADEDYMMARGSWSRLQPVIGPSTDGEEWRCWSIYTKLEGQYSDDNLITAERLSYGGANCLRGYRKRGYVGDYGAYGTVEFRTPVWYNFIADLCGAEAQSVIDRIQIALFTDAGWLGFNEAYAGMEEHEFLWSAGVGVRAALTQYLSLNADLAFPLVDGYASEQDKDSEIYVSLKFQW